MKKVVVLMAAVVVFLGMTGMAGAVQAGPEPFFALSDGTWTEFYGDGTPGSRGSYLTAVSDASFNYKGNEDNAWRLWGLYLDSVTPTGVLQYTTTYINPDFTPDEVGYYYEPGTGNRWSLTYLTATVIANFNEDGTYRDGYVTVTGNQTLTVDPPFSMNGYLFETSGDTSGHEGTISGIQVARVPEPATMLLLGLGLMGIAGIRRKS